MDSERTKKKRKKRSRTVNWSVSQTSVLLKLLKEMVQELGKGKEKFDGETWNRITAALNKKIGPQRNAKQVRLRLKNLKAEFSDYRACVEKPGWGWDGRKKLPVAPSETCWDEAIKLNNKLSKCRTKAFPWYKQVAEICGADVPVGENELMSEPTNEAMEEDILPLAGAEIDQSSGANSADDVSSSSSGKRTRDELEAVELEEEELQINGTDAAQGSLEDEKQEKSRIRNANWTDHQTSVLLNLMLEKYDSGITQYTQSFWKQICEGLNEKTRPHRKAAVLINRFKTLKTEFSDYRFCAETWGWYWDNEKGLPVAPNEACWDEITKINKKFQRCRTKPFWWYEQVGKLCNKNPETDPHKLLSQHPTGPPANESSNPQQLPLNSPLEHSEQSNNSAGERNPERMQEAPKDLTPSIYKEATNSYKLVAKKLVKLRSEFKLSRLDFIDMSVVVRDELNRELFMEQEGKELLDWIKDSLEAYRAQKSVQPSANRPFYMPVFPYPPPGGPYTPPPHM